MRQRRREACGGGAGEGGSRELRLRLTGDAERRQEGGAAALRLGAREVEGGGAAHVGAARVGAVAQQQPRALVVAADGGTICTDAKRDP